MPCSKTPDGLIPKPIKSTLSAHQNAAANAESLQKHWDTRSGYLNTEPCTQAGFKNGLSQSQIQSLVQIPCGLKPELPHSSKLKTLKSNNQELWRSQRAPSRAFCVRNFFSPSADMWLLKGLCTWVFLELMDCRLGAFQSWGVGFRASAFGGDKCLRASGSGGVGFEASFARREHVSNAWQLSTTRPDNTARRSETLDSNLRSANHKQT